MTYRACTIQDESDFFHVQYEKRRVLLAAERKCLVTHHRVTCLLHFKRECTSFAHARVCVCVCVLRYAHKEECAGERFITVPKACFSRWILQLCGNVPSVVAVLFFALSLRPPYFHIITPYDTEQCVALCFVWNRPRLGHDIPHSHLCGIKTRAFYLVNVE